jgi:hypothetical protein
MVLNIYCAIFCNILAHIENAFRWRLKTVKTRTWWVICVNGACWNWGSGTILCMQAFCPLESTSNFRVSETHLYIQCYIILLFSILLIYCSQCEQDIQVWLI